MEDEAEVAGKWPRAMTGPPDLEEARTEDLPGGDQACQPTGLNLLVPHL